MSKRWNKIVLHVVLVECLALCAELVRLMHSNTARWLMLDFLQFLRVFNSRMHVAFSICCRFHKEIIVLKVAFLLLLFEFSPSLSDQDVGLRGLSFRVKRCAKPDYRQIFKIVWLLQSSREWTKLFRIWTYCRVICSLKMKFYYDVEIA